METGLTMLKLGEINWELSRSSPQEEERDMGHKSRKSIGISLPKEWLRRCWASETGTLVNTNVKLRMV